MGDLKLNKMNVERCPECGSVKITQTKEQTSTPVGIISAQFWCRSCHFKFGEVEYQTLMDEAMTSLKEYEDMAIKRLIEDYEWENVLEKLNEDELCELLRLYRITGAYDKKVIQTYNDNLLKGSGCNE